MAKVNTGPYQRSHWRSPRGYGWWIFQNAETGDEVDFTANYGDAVRRLPAGRWRLLP